MKEIEIIAKALIEREKFGFLSPETIEQLNLLIKEQSL